ncbi:MAG: hypothetical protein HUK02_08085 [Bacteroidaceae bacterium]|nr:hypothetical protein [Bacteroidaceae bacterium]
MKKQYITPRVNCHTMLTTTGLFQSSPHSNAYAGSGSGKKSEDLNSTISAQDGAWTGWGSGEGTL